MRGLLDSSSAGQTKKNGAGSTQIKYLSSSPKAADMKLMDLLVSEITLSHDSHSLALRAQLLLNLASMGYYDAVLELLAFYYGRYLWVGTSTCNSLLKIIGGYDEFRAAAKILMAMNHEHKRLEVLTKWVRTLSDKAVEGVSISSSQGVRTVRVQGMDVSMVPRTAVPANRHVSSHGSSIGSSIGGNSTVNDQQQNRTSVLHTPPAYNTQFPSAVVRYIDRTTGLLDLDALLPPSSAAHSFGHSADTYQILFDSIKNNYYKDPLLNHNSTVKHLLYLRKRYNSNRYNIRPSTQIHLQWASFALAAKMPLFMTAVVEDAIAKGRLPLE
jgi:hypothetical protein